MHSTKSNSVEMERCAHACHECQDVCLALLPHCLERGGEHAALEHINILLDCIAICGVSHNLLHRKSSLHMETCRACAAICTRCAEDCDRLGDDPQMRRCVDECRRCASLCKEMSCECASSAVG
jgi:hypothetical protein